MKNIRKALLLISSILLMSCYTGYYLSDELDFDNDLILKQIYNIKQDFDPVINIYPSYKNEGEVFLKEIENITGSEFNKDDFNAGQYYLGYSRDLYCQTNNYPNVISFANILKKNNIPDKIAYNLIKIRFDMLKVCRENDFNKPDFKKINSEFARYLEATYHFYNKDFDEALKLYEELTNSTNPWLKETGFYMIARTYLVSSQKNYQYYIEGATADQELLNKSLQAFDNYLNLYPGNTYSNSVRAIKRKIYLLLGQKDKLNKELIGSIGNSLYSKTPDLVERFYEFRNFYTGSLESFIDLDPMAAFSYITSPNYHLDYKKTMDKLKELKSYFEETKAEEYYPYPQYYDPLIYNYLQIYLNYRMNNYDQVLKEFNSLEEVKPNDYLSIRKYYLAIESARKSKNWQRLLDLSSHIYKIRKSNKLLSRILLAQYKLGKIKEMLIASDVFLPMIVPILTKEQMIELMNDNNLNRKIKQEISTSYLSDLIIDKKYQEFIKISEAVTLPQEYIKIKNTMKKILLNKNDLNLKFQLVKFIISNNIQSRNCQILSMYNEASNFDYIYIKEFKEMPVEGKECKPVYIMDDIKKDVDNLLESNKKIPGKEIEDLISLCQRSYPYCLSELDENIEEMNKWQEKIKIE